MALLDFRAVSLPYCLKKTDAGDWLVLNREYKPIGFCTYDRVNIESLPIYLDLRITQKEIDKLVELGAKIQTLFDELTIFLYNDATNPFYKQNRQSYFDKLDILMDLRVDNRP
jgi:hypothetical protein